MQQPTQNQTHPSTGLLARLRSFCPARPLTLAEAKVVAERQANALLDWFAVTEAPTPFDMLDGMRRVQVVFETTPASGSTHWTNGAWLIALREDDAPARQRFSLFHELKHVIDHPMRSYLYPPERNWSTERKVERVAEYFAACVLMPKQLVKRHYFRGIQDVDTLAELFEVSPLAMDHRLIDDLRMIDPPRFTYACRSRQEDSRSLPFVLRDRRRPVRQPESTTGGRT